MTKQQSESRQVPSLPRGLSTWVYQYREGIAKQVREFNQRAKPDMRFRYFFPYAGAVDFPGKGHEMVLHYSTDIPHHYAETLPADILIMPIVDGRSDHGEFDDWTEEEYGRAARKVADRILADPEAAGVQIDIEPFHPSHLPFYRQLRGMLNAGGKFCTMFVGPRSEKLLTEIFESCDIVVMSGYDIAGEGAPLDKYRTAMKRALALFQRVAHKTKGHYMIGIPAAASWGEFEYIAGGGSPREETGVKQEEYVEAALEAIAPYRERPEFVGISLWHMSDPETEFERPEDAKKRTKFPNIIRESVWRILERY